MAERKKQKAFQLKIESGRIKSYELRMNFLANVFTIISVQFCEFSVDLCVTF